MSARLERAEAIRDQILKDPDLILEDRDVMRALIEANGGAAAAGRNVVDLRGVLVDRLENRLDRREVGDGGPVVEPRSDAEPADGAGA